MKYLNKKRKSRQANDMTWIPSLPKRTPCRPGSQGDGCNNCGACCRGFPFIRLSRNNIETLENFTGLASEEFTDSIDEAGEKRFMKFKENGDCVFLKMIDGAYSCGVYEARPPTCREYPSTDIQKETCRAESGREGKLN